MMRPVEPADEHEALQTRCPSCLAEQYCMNVIAFSSGEVPCGVCGHRTAPMTRAQWAAALAATERQRERSGPSSWTPLKFRKERS